MKLGGFRRLRESRDGVKSDPIIIIHKEHQWCRYLLTLVFYCGIVRVCSLTACNSNQFSPPVYLLSTEETTAVLRQPWKYTPSTCRQRFCGGGKVVCKAVSLQSYVSMTDSPRRGGGRKLDVSIIRAGSTYTNVCALTSTGRSYVPGISFFSVRCCNNVFEVSTTMITFVLIVRYGHPSPIHHSSIFLGFLLYTFWLPCTEKVCIWCVAL